MKLKKILSTILASFVMSTLVLTNMPTTKMAFADDYVSYNGNDLGCIYTKDKTTFKVWSPKAGKVQLNRYTTGSDDTSKEKVKPEKIETLDMKKDNSGVWSVEVSGDIKNTYYTYSVDGAETPDIYGKTTGVNGNRSMVIDLDSTDPAGWENDKRVDSPNQTDAVVWEVHVKDFSYDKNSGISDKNRGKYLAFTEQGTKYSGTDIKTGIDHLKELGVTHVQILPMYDYASVDEAGSDDQFNWGYDPKNFNTPEGSYSSNPYDGNARVTELKEMVKALHDAGIGVIMDVVYNHSYAPFGQGGSQNDFQKNEYSPFERTVPGYYYTSTDWSGCGNSFDTKKPMYSKFIVDSMVYWAEEYHLDGFRFDLMGIIDNNTLTEVRNALNKIDPQIKMWGEPWCGDGSKNSMAGYGNKANIKNLDGNIAVFSDNARDAIKGNTWDGKLSNAGWVTGNGSRQTEVIAGMKAMCGDYDNVNQNIWSKQPSQVITYTSCHDNHALYDILCMSTGKNQDGQRYDDIVAMNKLAASIVLTSQGISFMQAGEEFARSKLGDHNSYQSSPDINKLDWSRLKTYSDVNEYYSGLIKIRKNFSAFRDPTYGSANKIQWLNTSTNKQIGYLLENNKSGEWNKIVCLFNADSNDSSINLPSGEYVVIANDTKAGIESLGEASGNVTLKGRSSMILVDKSSFNSTTIKEKSTVTVIYKDEDGKVLDSETLNGNVGDDFKTESKEIEGYELIKIPANATGKYTKANQEVEYVYKIMDSNDDDDKTDNDNTQDKDDKSDNDNTQDKDDKSDNDNTQDKDDEEDNIDPIKITKITVTPKSINVGDNVTVKAQVTGGDGNTKYQFKVDGVIKKKYSSNNTFSWSPSEPGEVKITVNVKDDSGNSNTLSQLVVINSLNDEDDSQETVKGKVIVKYVDSSDGTVLEEKVLTDDVGDKYSSEELEFDGYELINRPSKANGKYTEDVITIKYKYQKIEEDNEPSDKDDNKVDSADINNIIMIITLLSCSIFVIGVTSKKEI